jgi:molybdate transport system ATP-binding protein
VTLDVDIRLRIGAFDLQPRFRATDGITALFGPSGAGKTLTLRCIAGLLRPDTGRISLNNRTLFDSETRTDLPARSRSIGFVFQQYALFPHLTVEQNIAFGLDGMTKAERADRVRDLLEIIGLPGAAPRFPSQLSGGQQQRVALARALAPEPALLLLDEPFAAVDQPTRRRLRSELCAIQERIGTPMLLVTHDLDEVRQLCRLMVVVDSGHVVGSGVTDALLTPPFNPEVAPLFE